MPAKTSIYDVMTLFASKAIVHYQDGSLAYLSKIAELLLPVSMSRCIGHVQNCRFIQVLN